MELNHLFAGLVGKPANVTLEYKATLIPSRSIAQILAGFANTDGGTLIFGVRERPYKPIDVQGISSDFNIQGIVVKAIGYLIPTPQIAYSYFQVEGRQLFGIQIGKSEMPVLVEGNLYRRVADQTVNLVAKEYVDKATKFPRFTAFKESVGKSKDKSTSAKNQLLNHYINILKLYDPAMDEFFNGSVVDRTISQEGRVLNRLLFISGVDNFETYLSDLLYEIYLAKPETLKGGESTVKVADVLECADIDEFIQRFAAKRISKLQKGSIRGFIKENVELSALESVTSDQISEIEKILQIRHLYSHRNGIVDESFLNHFRGQFQIGTEHQLSITEVLDKLEYLLGVVNKIDERAVAKYGLSIQ